MSEQLREPLHPPRWWKRRAARHEAAGEHDLARLCAEGAASAAYRAQLKEQEKQRQQSK